jgi:hypothetical protein
LLTTFKFLLFDLRSYPGIRGNTTHYFFLQSNFVSRNQHSSHFFKCFQHLADFTFDLFQSEFICGDWNISYPKHGESNFDPYSP